MLSISRCSGPQRPWETASPSSWGIVLTEGAELIPVPLGFKDITLLTQRCGLDQSDKIANSRVKKISHVAAVFLLE